MAHLRWIILWFPPFGKNAELHNQFAIIMSHRPMICLHIIIFWSSNSQNFMNFAE
jgi:hypothetical protein